MKLKQILITGASGFVGQNLTEYLQKSNLEVTLLTRMQLQQFDASMLKDIDTVIHLAGKAHDLKKMAAIDEYYEVNFELTKKLYNVFLESNAKKFIFISSVKAAADAVDGILTEETAPAPQTHYGKSKLMAEDYIKSQLIPADQSYYILRPCMIHGPNNKGNLNLLYQVVKKGFPYPLAAFENKRSFLSIKNLCFIISELISQSNVPSGVYNAADDEALSTTEVVRILAKSVGRKPLLWKISKRFITNIARIGDTFKLPLTTERLNKLTDNYVVSNLKIIKTLKIELPMSATNGLQETANSFHIKQ